MTPDNSRYNINSAAVTYPVCVWNCNESNIDQGLIGIGAGYEIPDDNIYCFKIIYIVVSILY